MKNGRYILRLTLTLFLITAVVAALLGLTDLITRGKIAALTEQKLQNAMHTVLAADSYESTEVPPEAQAMVAQVFTASKAGERAGCVIEVKPSGFGGEVDLMVGIDAQGRVTGIRVINHSETSGLGAIAAADSLAGAAFREQFTGSSGSTALKKDGGQLDALTGATVTSRAVSAGVNAALACAALLTEGGGA